MYPEYMKDYYEPINERQHIKKRPEWAIYKIGYSWLINEKVLNFISPQHIEIETAMSYHYPFAK